MAEEIDSSVVLDDTTEVEVTEVEIIDDDDGIQTNSNSNLNDDRSINQDGQDEDVMNNQDDMVEETTTLIHPNSPTVVLASKSTTVESITTTADEQETTKVEVVRATDTTTAIAAPETITTTVESETTTAMTTVQETVTTVAADRELTTKTGEVVMTTPETAVLPLRSIEPTATTGHTETTTAQETTAPETTVLPVLPVAVEPTTTSTVQEAAVTVKATTAQETTVLPLLAVEPAKTATVQEAAVTVKATTAPETAVLPLRPLSSPAPQPPPPQSTPSAASAMKTPVAPNTVESPPPTKPSIAVPPQPPAKPPTIISNIAAFRAAATDIAELIEMLGSVDMKLCEDMICTKLQMTSLVNRYFPRSLSADQVVHKVKQSLEKRGYSPNQFILGHSVCPEGRTKKDLVNALERVVGQNENVFALGGLAGLPFTGKAGFNLFAARVPLHGHGFVLVAPHVNLTLRQLSSNQGTANAGGDCSIECCRAAASALEYCCGTNVIPDLAPEDYQMGFIIQQVDRVKEIIYPQSDDNMVQTDLATQMHRIAKQLFEKIDNRQFGGDQSALIVLTGIQINMPESFPDFFQPRSFYVHQKDGRKVDLFREVFAGN